MKEESSMKLIDIFYETSPFTYESTNEILYDDKIFLNEEEKYAFFRMLDNEVTNIDSELFIGDFCELANSYIMTRRAPVTYKQALRDKLELWGYSLGQALHMQKEEVQECMTEALCIPIKEELTCKMLKELHPREGVTSGELVKKFGVTPRTIYNEIEKIKGTKGVARIYGQQIQVPISEEFVPGENNKSHVKKFCTKNTVNPVMLQMNISQTATLLSALAHAYLSNEKSIARTVGFEVWAQLSDYAQDRIKQVYKNIDEELYSFIEELSDELETGHLLSFQTEIEAYQELNLEEQVITLFKTQRKCKITFIDDGKKEVLSNCVVKKNRNGKGFLFEGTKENGEKDILEYNCETIVELEVEQKNIVVKN